MKDMTDTEFVDAIEARLRANGWTTGRIGTPTGPNCLLGAAGFVAHNGDLIVDERGVNPLRCGNIVSRASEEALGYSEIPGMARLATMMGTSTSEVACINDSARDIDDVIEEMKMATDNV